MRFQGSEPYLEAIVNADFGSSASSSNFPSIPVMITKVVIGQDQNGNGVISNTYPFEGKISAVNIWQGILDDWNMEQWYLNNGIKVYQPLVKWPLFGDPANRVGNVHYVSITAAGRSKLIFQVPS